MPNSNPFSSDYAGAPPTQVAIAPAAATIPVFETMAAHEQQHLGVVVGHAFKITPISTVNGKPKRVIIRGKVTRD